ncbi:hypothetical protein [Actinomadura alba]|uniref:Uncharacterized protein n=1 Tax=Actinomadura alba TaxID=406431 RepID=A0ABR7LX29_9ACTN|nr:hypothetical protein [Actinomadura alba]MBC6469316.1 hypothetical protein [Actinomadura alba]
MTCLLDDASVGEALEGIDLTGKDLVPGSALPWALDREKRQLFQGADLPAE